MEYAKLILDDYVITPKEGWKFRGNYYHISNLEKILRSHSQEPITDIGEVAIRGSFDSLLQFFAKLDYLVKIHHIRLKYIDYFNYYINRASNEKARLQYIRYYEFQLPGVLHPNLNYNLTAKT